MYIYKEKCFRKTMKKNDFLFFRNAFHPFNEESSAYLCIYICIIYKYIKISSKTFPIKVSKYTCLEKDYKLGESSEGPLEKIIERVLIQ